MHSNVKVSFGSLDMIVCTRPFHLLFASKALILLIWTQGLSLCVMLPGLAGPAVILVLSTKLFVARILSWPEEPSKQRHLRKTSFTDQKKPFFSDTCHLNWLSRSPCIIPCLEVVKYRRMSNRQDYGHRRHLWSEICLQAVSACGRNAQ